MKTKVNLRDIEILKKRIIRGVKGLVRKLNYLYKHRADELFYDVDYYEDIINELGEGVRLINEYNLLGLGEIKKVRDCYVVGDLSKSYIPKSIVNIRNILRELQTARDYLCAYLKPNLSEVEKGKIDLLRKELETLQSEEKIIKNLDIALMEAESGHELACGIISARVIVERLEKIEGRSDEERLANLVRLKIIDSNESSRFSSKAFLDASRAGRNAVSHQNSWFPTGSEAFSLLSYAFRMAQWVSEYERKIKEDKNKK